MFTKLLSEAPELSYYDIDISPPDIQYQTWEVNGIPISATAMFYPFDTMTGVWQMRGLHGCTAIFILSKCDVNLALTVLP